jgi:peroxiredoxin Q/BCP
MIPCPDDDYAQKGFEGNMTELSIGDQAPDFTLPRNGGGAVSLANYSGKNVVLYFYPKDNTQSCTIEALEFTALGKDFETAGAVIIGVSPDSVKKHDNFCKKYDLSVILAADTDRRVINAYGLWAEKQMYGVKYMGVERTTYLIDKQGRIAKIWSKVKVKDHARNVLEAARELG